MDLVLSQNSQEQKKEPKILHENVDLTPIDLVGQIGVKDRLRPSTGVIRHNKPKKLHIVEPVHSGSDEGSGVREKG